MSLAKTLRSRHIILASGSPRRQQFLRDLGLEFDMRLIPVEENYPSGMTSTAVAEYLAELKATPHIPTLTEKDILITGDTIVSQEDTIFGKPKTREEAVEMLNALSGKSHQVISSVCLKSTTKTTIFHDLTTVYFKALTAKEISYYIDTYSPYDKAGAYGIQEWIGKIGITRINGSFYNVMGMPVNKLYAALLAF